jgi:hypothetical protein
LHDPAANTYDARFGCSVAVSWNTAVVGADGTKEVGGSEFGYGAAWTYAKGAAGWPAMPTANLYIPWQGYGVFGYSVAVSRTTVMIGVPGEWVPGVLIFVKHGSSWSNPPTGFVSGRSVAMSGTTAIVGEYDQFHPFGWDPAADIYRV